MINDVQDLPPNWIKADFEQCLLKALQDWYGEDGAGVVTETEYKKHVDFPPED